MTSDTTDPALLLAREICREHTAKEAAELGYQLSDAWAAPLMAGEFDYLTGVQAALAAIKATTERAAALADRLHYPDETKISASIRDALRAGEHLKGAGDE